MANRALIQSALQKPYDRLLFGKEVLSPVFGSCFTLSTSAVPASVQPNKSELAVIQSVFIYGYINLEDGTEITCYEINLQPAVRIEHNKVAIQRYVRKLLTAGQIALVNFIAPQNKNVWRLTLVAKDSELTQQGIKEKTTNAKRYTYLLGPSETCKTAAERFETLSTEKQITFQALVNAFSVEKLSKAFFDEYTLHYQQFCNYLLESNFRKSVFKISISANATKEEKDKASKPIRDFVKKLLGRIVFLYFVQKKGWLGASDIDYKDGPNDFIKKLFTQSGGNDSFYPKWLTVLFFETLNKERSNDDFIMPDGKKVKVPFLNGGLFDKEDYDEAILPIPAKLFHRRDFEDTILTEKNWSNARGFLDFLDAFNFTVHEDSPDDHTVAVDPEMLGHIFENLLEDNKDKGAFYTPKEIVHYMCQESLTEYLTTHLSKEYTVYKEIGNAQVELFGSETKTGQLKMVEQLGDKALNRDDVAYIVKQKDISHLTKPQLKKIDSFLDTVKICDPAIGSGAFPMGLLQEIHAIKEVIAFELQQPRKPAEVKENIIQNSVYGVDIEKGAVDIARLRFWLSLVVDEEKPRALPNLDYKIVVGDSLVSKFEGEIIEIDWAIKEGTQAHLFGNENVLNRQTLLKKITAKQKEYF
ncbi:MAG: DNA methyltransferase, partial [Bacteroidota bacterium]